MKKISAKHFCAAFLAAVFGVNLAMCALNLSLDVYALKSLKNKRAEFITSEKIALYPARVAANAPFYVLGTSRTQYLDYHKLARWADSHVIRLGMSGATDAEWLFLLKRVKARNARVLLGFDAFSLNKNGHAKVNGMRLGGAFEEGNFWRDVAFNFFVAGDSLASLTKNALGFSPDKMLKDYDARHFELSREELEAKFFGKNSEKIHYENFEIDFDITAEIAALLDARDIVVVFPKYAEYYALFKKYGVESAYFRAIRIIVERSEAQVWAFYGANCVSENAENFDDDGWHFKPRVGDKILARIFGDLEALRDLDSLASASRENGKKCEFGVKITRENVDLILKKYAEEKWEF